MYFLHFSIRSFLVDTNNRLKEIKLNNLRCCHFSQAVYRKNQGKLPEKKTQKNKPGLFFFFLFPTKRNIQLLDHSTVTASAAAILEDDNHSLLLVKPGQGYMSPP